LTRLAGDLGHQTKPDTSATTISAALKATRSFNSRDALAGLGGRLFNVPSSKFFHLSGRI
jgi:hypothetical protein